MNRSPKAPNSKPKTLRVAAVQMILAGSIAGNLEKIERAAIRAAAEGDDAVLFPECATTGYAFDFGALNPAALRQALHSVAAVAARLGINLLAGSPILLDLSRATRKYALDSLNYPRFLANHWRRVLPELRRRVREADRMFQRWFISAGSVSVP